MVDQARAALSRWTMAIVIAMVGASVTVGGGVIAGSIAYGELRQQAASSDRLLGELRTEVAGMRRDLRHAGP